MLTSPLPAGANVISPEVAVIVLPSMFKLSTVTAVKPVNAPSNATETPLPEIDVVMFAPPETKTLSFANTTVTVVDESSTIVKSPPPKLPQPAAL